MHDGVFKAWGSYGGQQLEVDWKSKTRRDCDITFRALLIAFYEVVFGVKAEGNEIHSGISIDGLTLVFDHVDIAEENPAFRYVKADGANNVIVGFNVDDVDAEYNRLLALGAEMLNEPTTHPWGARSFQFRDPDGNILNFRTITRD